MRRKQSVRHLGFRNISLNYVFCDIPIPTTNDGRITSNMRGKGVGIETKTGSDTRIFLRLRIIHPLNSLGGWGGVSWDVFFFFPPPLFF